jgi:hypothetical protein
MILIQEGKIFVEGKETNDPTLIGLAMLDFANSPNYSPVDLSLRKEQREKQVFFFIDVVHEKTKYNFSQAASEFEIRVKEKMLLHKQQNNLKKESLVTPAEALAVVDAMISEAEKKGFTTTEEQKQDAIKQINNLKK